MRDPSGAYPIVKRRISAGRNTKPNLFKTADILSNCSIDPDSLGHSLGYSLIAIVFAHAHHEAMQ
jgi:hypothetical protein